LSIFLSGGSPYLRSCLWECGGRQKKVKLCGGQNRGLL